MQRMDIAFDLGGAIHGVKFTLTYVDLTTAGLTQEIRLQEDPTQGAVTVTPTTYFYIPQGGVILYSKIKHSTAFSGTAITAMTVSLGKYGGSATFVQPAFDVFQAVADTTLQEADLTPNSQHTGWIPSVTFTSVGANLTAATAGSVDVYIYFLNTSTASSPSTTPGLSGGGTGV